MTATRIHADRLTAFGTRILTSLGVPEIDARLVSDSLVTADLWGHASHGMLRLPWYVARLRSGATRPVTRPETVVDSGAVAVIDGHDGIGQVIADRACQEAVARAGRHGVAAVAVRNSNHFGTAAYWTRRMAGAGCVGILTTNGSPAMAPWGGREKTVGANPWSIATPGGSAGPLVLDIANTAVARGKIYAARQRGEAIPADWAIGADGLPVTDPHVAVDGILAPMAAHKGYAISFMMDILSGVLTGSSYATDVTGPYVPDRRSGCGHLVLALRVDAILDPETFRQRVDDLVTTTKRVPLAANATEIYYPGEIEERAEARGRSTGVMLPERTLQDLRELADTCDVLFDITDTIVRH
ncbi:Ldh family oxidoreductase [Micromonospora sp. SL4-19]|uniref:Ldh family oxidoreductase n=1 Tax=Micromonospora sp. SL4-19 TaxID=3399129 RepID=UPI003A4DD5C8